jgi:plasmid stability protein
MATAQIELTDEQMAALRAAAERRRLSVPDFVRQVVEAALVSEEQPASDEAWERASRAIGKFRSVEGDMSVRHDDIFVEAALGE